MHVDDQDQGSEVYTELENSSTGANNSQNNVDKEPSYTPVLISFLQYCRKRQILFIFLNHLLDEN